MRRAPSNQRGLRSGFTLVELVATIVILAAIGSIASNLILTSTDGYVDAATSAQLHTEASIGLDRIVRELRKIELDDAASEVAPNIDSVTAASIAWNDNCNLTLTGSNLMLVDNGAAAAVLLSDVSSFSVQAFDADNTAMASTLNGAECDDVRRILITLTLQRAGVSEILRTKLFIRSTMVGAEGGV